MRTLFILNDPPYGSERAYQGLRLAASLAGREGEEVRVFLLGDATLCGKAGQRVPRGHYNVEGLLRSVLRTGDAAACGACLDARGIREEELGEGIRRGALHDLTEWTVWADRVLVF